MNLAAVILHLRDNVNRFGGRVAGAAEFQEAVQSQGLMDLPAAYVVPLDLDAGPNENQTGLFQRATERVGVIVVFSNSADLDNDRRGQTVTELYDLVMRELFAALLNWRPAPYPGDFQRAVRGFSFAGGEMLTWDRGRLFYQWSFALEIQIGDGDGWQETYDTLTEADFTVPATGSGASVEATIEIPQD